MFWLLLLILAAIPAIFCTKKKPNAPAVKQKTGMPKKKGTFETSVSTSEAKAETKREAAPKKDESLKFKTLTSSAESLKTDLRSLDDGPNPLMDAEIREKLMKRLENKNKKDAGPMELGKSQEMGKTPCEQPPKPPTSKVPDSDNKGKDVKSDKTQPDATQATMKTEDVKTNATLATKSIMPTVAATSVMQPPSVIHTLKKKSEANCTLEGTGNPQQQGKTKRNVAPPPKKAKPIGAIKPEEMTQKSTLQSQLEVESTMNSHSNETDKKKPAEKK